MNKPYHALFDACAGSLDWMAKKLDPVWPGGMDYVKINVLIFCVAVPAVLPASLGLNVALLTGLL